MYTFASQFEVHGCKKENYNISSRYWVNQLQIRGLSQKAQQFSQPLNKIHLEGEITKIPTEKPTMSFIALYIPSFITIYGMLSLSLTTHLHSILISLIDHRLERRRAFRDTALR